MDDNCKGMVMFHSDKMQELDIQANSTPNKEYDKAMKYFSETIDKYPFLIDALTGMGYVKLEQNDKAAAKKYFQDALKLSP